MANITRRNEGGTGDLRREIDRLFEDFFSPDAMLGVPRREFVPRIDVRETERGYVLRAELPGMEPNQLELDIDNDVLTLRGEKRQEEERSGRGYAYSELSYGSFARSIQLPRGTDPSKVQAEFKNGLLEVQIPKSEAARPRRISVGGTASSALPPGTSAGGQQAGAGGQGQGQRGQSQAQESGANKPAPRS